MLDPTPFYYSILEFLEPHLRRIYREELDSFLLKYNIIQVPSALNLIIAHSPEIAILDINMPGMDGIEVLEKVYEEKLQVKIILLTMHNERSIYNRAYELGGYGYLLKNFADTELELCLKEVIIGRKFVSEHINKELVFKADDNNDETNVLTLTEKKILQLIGEQKTSKQIAQLLFIAEKTVEGHRRNIVNKLKLPKEKNILLHYAAKYSI